MAAQQKTNKGNPAHKRMGNDALKARRNASWRRGKIRKGARQDAQRELEKANKIRRENGLPTPWEARVGLEAIERMAAAKLHRQAQRAIRERERLGR